MRLLEAVKNDPPDASANEDSEQAAPGDEVGDFFRGDIRVAAPREVAVEPESGERGEHV